MAGQLENSPEKLGVMSPFGQARETDGKPLQTSSIKPILIGVAASLVILLVVFVGWTLWRGALNDPYRTLEVFSADKYFESPSMLTGNRFKATLCVQGDLGWSSEEGKLMVFSVEGDPRYIPVLVQGKGLSLAFSKGQTYLAQIQVKEGGLLCATELKKN